MGNRLQAAFVLGLTSFIILGLSPSSVNAKSGQGDRSENYKDLLNTTDDITRSLRLGNEVDNTRLARLENKYRSVFDKENNKIGNEIESFFQTENASKLKAEDFRALRGKFEKLADSEDIELSFIYEHAIFVILAISFVLAFVVNMISRTTVDWEQVNKVKRKQSELQDELKKARRESDMKKVHKLQEKQKKFMQEHMGTMLSPMKTMLIIFIPFIIVLRLMMGTYGGWVVAWLPFNLPWPNIDFLFLSRFFSGDIASLGFFGWYILSYFGLSQIWRKTLIPSA